MKYDNNEISQNLIDAGCDSQFIQKFMSLQSMQKTKEMISLLEVHRRHLLDLVHTEERKICCLDYLVNKLTQNKY